MTMESGLDLGGSVSIFGLLLLFDGVINFELYVMNAMFVYIYIIYMQWERGW